jgi:hypothetical protein
MKPSHGRCTKLQGTRQPYELPYTTEGIPGFSCALKRCVTYMDGNTVHCRLVPGR